MVERLGAEKERVSVKKEEVRILLEEYRSITDMHKHFDGMNLTMMSTVTAAVFILWGVILQSPGIPGVLLVPLATIVFLILTTWIRYMTIHRSIVVRKLARAAEIESTLGMKQNRICQYDDEIRRQRRRPGAHAAEIMVYWLLTLLGIGVMVYGATAREIQAPCSLAQLWERLKPLWYLPLAVLFHGAFALFWGLKCRIEVAEVIPHYQLPRRDWVRWLFLKLGYRDLYREVKQS